MMMENNVSDSGEFLRLEGVLLTEVPRERFCCRGNNQDGRMCILYGDGLWYVFFREGPLCEDLSVHRSFTDAALQLIRNVAPSEAAEERMRGLFLGKARPE